VAANLTLTHLEYCTYCPKMCRHACPVSTTTGRETLIPQAKMATLNRLRKGHAGWDAETAEPIWGCTGCGACTEYCAHGVQPGPTLFAGRAEAVRRGAAPAAVAAFPERFRAREEKLRKRALAELPRPRFSEDAPVAIWPGCDAIDEGADDVRAELALFDRLGADHVRLADAAQMCGGYPLLAAGYPDAFRWHAGRVAAELSRHRMVVMSCAACLHAVRALYPREGVHVAAEVVHVTEFLLRMTERIVPPPATSRPTVWYHDPCYLARHLAVLEPPRKLIARVADIRELAWSRKDTECCGGGGLLPETMPAVADAMARRRLAEVADAGGGTVVTSCSTCKHMLARNAPPGVVVREVVEYVEATSRAGAAPP
jgi:fumarate reductase (CoM/CoB) subunit B